MFHSCLKAFQIISSSLDEHALMEGVSDIIVVRDSQAKLRSTQFFACFGSHSVGKGDPKVQVLINKILINDLRLTANKYGYVYPMKLNEQQLNRLCLRLGKNTIEYRFRDSQLLAEIYYYSETQKLIVSDVDGTLTRSDLGGLYNNWLGHDYLHDGYNELLSMMSANGYKIVWMTMRSLPLYNFSKKYIKEQVGIDGPLLMEPEEFFQAVKKEVMKNTGNVKANIMKDIKRSFPSSVSPFAGGLGNRENDAIAYLHSGIPAQSIYVIDSRSDVHKLSCVQHRLSYHELAQEIAQHFPPLNSLQTYNSENRVHLSTKHKATVRKQKRAQLGTVNELKKQQVEIKQGLQDSTASSWHKQKKCT